MFNRKSRLSKVVLVQCIDKIKNQLAFVDKGLAILEVDEGGDRRHRHVAHLPNILGGPWSQIFEICSCPVAKN